MSRTAARSKARAAARLAAVQALYQHEMEATAIPALLHEFHHHRLGDCYPGNFLRTRSCNMKKLLSFF